MEQQKDVTARHVAELESRLAQAEQAAAHADMVSLLRPDSIAPRSSTVLPCTWADQ